MPTERIVDFLERVSARMMAGGSLESEVNITLEPFDMPAPFDDAIISEHRMTASSSPKQYKRDVASEGGRAPWRIINHA